VEDLLIDIDSSRIKHLACLVVFALQTTTDCGYMVDRREPMVNIHFNPKNLVEFLGTALTCAKDTSACSLNANATTM